MEAIVANAEDSECEVTPPVAYSAAISSFGSMMRVARTYSQNTTATPMQPYRFTNVHTAGEPMKYTTH